MESSDLKVRQYFCSGVIGEGPFGSLTGGRDVTGAAIFLRIVSS